jgi:multicomponent Na+:H+ antiporter subunit D
VTLGLPPGLLLIAGALLAPALRGPWRSGYLMFLPAFGLYDLIVLEHGSYLAFTIASQQIVPVRIDRLSLAFGYIFHIAAFLAAIYGLHVKDTVQQVAAMMLAGAGVGAVCAGDLLTLFVYWEALALSSVFLIWARRTERAYRAGMRYLVIQVGSGVLLLAGAIIHTKATGSVAFEQIGLGGTGSALIFLAFGIKCAFPLLHNWLQDAYPESTGFGTVVLSAFTTKTAVYALARGYPGTEALIYIGTAMTAFPIFYAVIENDLRRVLAYSLNNQLGFMVVGVGVGSQIALNGAVAHAVADILFKALLFMAMGAVLLRTGTVKGSELGGLYKSMPLTMTFCIVGAASISAFPLFSGFVTKSLVIAGVAEQHYAIVWLILMFASAGVFHHAGIKIPYFAFFAHDSGIRCKEAPSSMLIAMSLTAAGCIAIGIHSPLLYSILPYSVDYAPYTTTHVIEQYQLLLFSALAFAMLVRYRIYPPELRSTNLDFDWFYRKGAPALILAIWGVVWPGYRGIVSELRAGVDHFIAGVFRHHGPEGALARSWPTGSMALWVAVLLGGFLVLYYAGLA